MRDSLRRLGPARLNNLLPYYLFPNVLDPALFLTLRCNCVCALHTVQKNKGLVRRFFRMSYRNGFHKKATTRGFQRKKPRIADEDSPLSPALLITSPPSPPSFSGPSSTGEWFRFLRFPLISLKHSAFSALHPSMPTGRRVFHPRSTTVHLLCLWLLPLSVRITL